jgi:transcriptional regulator with XRE-family HTH domain
MKEKKKTIGEAIADYRIIKQISQQTMADDLHMSLKRLVEIESGEIEIEEDLLETIADYLGIPVSAIIFKILTVEHFEDPKIKELFQGLKPILKSLIYFALDKTEPEINMKINKDRISDN